MPCFGCLGQKEDAADYEAHNVKHEFFEVGLAHDMNIAHRKTMEDAHVVKVPFMGDPTAGFFAVYDGHGGSEASEEVANQFHGLFEAEIRSKTPPNYKECFEAAYSKMDENLKTIATDKGATSVTCLIRKEGVGMKLFIANAGDARAILSRNGRAVRLTQDHKPSDEKEKKRITDSGGFITNDRVNGILGVSRAFGDHLLKKWVVSTPFYVDTDLQEGDSMVIIACDGVWDVMQDQEVIESARGESSRSSSVSVCHALLLDPTILRYGRKQRSVSVTQSIMARNLQPNESFDPKPLFVRNTHPFPFTPPPSRPPATFSPLLLAAAAAAQGRSRRSA